MLISDASSRLRKLGLRTPLEVVREAAQRLQNGESLYRLHSGEIPLVAKATARKIKELLDEGKLSFLFGIQPDVEAVRSAMEAVEAESGPEPFQSRPELVSQSKLASRIELMPGGSSFNVYPGVFKEKADTFVFNMVNFDWNIEHLESIGIPLDEALSLLVEHDILLTRWPRWDSSDDRRFAEISGIAIFCREQTQRKQGAPYELIKMSAVAWAKGLSDNSPFLLATSVNILSYQVWRGPQFLQAFNQAQVATHRAARRLKQKYEKLITNMSIQFQTDTDNGHKEQADG